ncbi:MAG: Gldg family protein [Deltaproteobacteria bacterium]|nr:Gldg family protein [Deltaproteobacteria bacterium]
MNKNNKTAVSIALIIVILVLLNLVSSALFRHFRIDLTEEKLYTLSKGTQNILSKLEDDLKFKFYLTKEATESIPGIKAYSTRVKEILEEYKKLSGGKTTLLTLNPKPDTEEEELAQKYGLQKVPLQKGESLYMGLVIADESGNSEVIPFFNPDREKFLEYDISKAIVNITNPERKNIGILSFLPVTGDKQQSPSPFGRQNQGGNAWAIMAQLEQLYKVRDIPLETEKINDDIDVLLLIHPKNIPAKTKMAIDQYLLKGGKVAAFIDPSCESDSPPPNPKNPYEAAFYDRSSNLGELLAAWGLSMSSDELAADMNIAANVRNANYQVVPYPVYLNIGEEQLKSDEILSGGVDNIVLATAGILRAEGNKDGIEISPIIKTTKEANFIKKEPFMNPDSVQKNFRAGSSELVLAYRVSGKFKTAFPQGIDNNGTTIMPDVKESKEASTVVVFSDVDFITDRLSANVSTFFGRRVINLINDNLNLAFNTIETLAGSQDLISIRSRGKFNRPFTKVADMQREAQEKWRSKEAELQTKVEELERKLSELQSRRGDKFKGQVLTAEQLQEIENFKAERLDYQKQLRQVRKNLREDVENLQRNLKIANIWLMPLLVAISAFILHITRSKRRRSL